MIITAGALVGFMLAEEKALATLPIALQHFANMLTSYPASMLMERIGRKAGFLIACGVGIVGGAVATWSILNDQFVVFCLASAAFGVFTGFGHFFRFAATEVAEEDYKSRAISYVLAGGILAAFIGPNLANFSQEWITSARFAGSYAALIAIYLLAAIAILLMKLPKPNQAARVQPVRTLWQVAMQGRYIAAMTCATLGYAMMSLVMTATPLAMSQSGLPFSSTASVIQWHVVGMFAPSFFTGHLIRRFGCANILLVGGFAVISCIVINLLGQSLWHFWSALFLMGIAWNFLYIGGTTLLTETYQPEEKAKAQGFNDLVMFSTVTVAALSAGALQHNFGWSTVNMGVAPAACIILICVFWLKTSGRQPAPAVSG